MQTPVTSQLTIKPKRLSIEDLKSLKIENGFFIVDHSSRGWKLKNPVRISVEKVLATGERGLVDYIISSFTSERPSLIPFVFENQSLIRLARHFLRHCSGSIHSMYVYTNAVHRYCSWLGYSPDLIIQDLKPQGAIPDPLRVQNHAGFLEQYVAVLQDTGSTRGYVYCQVKLVKSFYRVNGAEIKLTEPLSRRVTFKDRSPKAEELACLLDISDLREKVVVTMLSLGAFREETLTKLQYRHVREDLERGVVPIHVHVEAEITKGKYHDYDTFLNGEAAEYLKLYLRLRRLGSPDGRTPLEDITDTSPLIRDKTTHLPRSVGPKQIRKIVHQLYAKAGLLRKPTGRMYNLRAHGLRKYFKTQLLALGVQPDYVEYMMGHTVDTYHDIEMKGIEFLRNIYATSGLSIKPKTKVSKIDTLKEIIRAWGLNPEQILTREALAQDAAVHIDQERRADNELQILGNTLKELIRQESSKARNPEQ